MPAPSFPTPPQQNAADSMSPPTAQTPGFFDNNDDAILNQLQTLMVVTRQNQEAIQHILGYLEKQQRTNLADSETDIGQRAYVRKRSRQHSTPRADTIVENEGSSTSKGQEVASPGSNLDEAATHEDGEHPSGGPPS